LIQKKQKIKANPNGSARFAAQRHGTSSLYIRSFHRLFGIVKVGKYLFQLKFYGVALHVQVKLKSKNTVVAVGSIKGRVWVCLQLKAFFAAAICIYFSSTFFSSGWLSGRVIRKEAKK
jgi:hypothetical protein